MNDLEVSKLKLVIDGDDGDKTLNQLLSTQKEVNKALRDMKAAGEEGSEAWKELKRIQADLKTEIKEFNDAIDLSDASMKELQSSSRQLNRDLADMKAGSQEWIEQMNRIGETDARISEVRQEMARLRQEAIENSQAYKDLQAAQARVNEELKEAVRNIDLNDASMAQLTAKSRLLNEELDELKTGSDEWIAKMKEIDQVDTKIARVGEEMDGLRTNIDKVPTALDRVKEGFASTFAAFSLENIIEEFIQFGKESVSAAAEMSDAMADIGKATDMTEAEVAGLVEQINKIDTRTATEDLNEIAVVAGQLGIAKNDVLGFVESVDKAVVALGDEFTGGAEEVAKSIGGLQKLFKETKDLEAGVAINEIGSALNALGAAGSATAPVVADFTARMGQLGDLSPQISETMGLGAAFEELGLTAEIAAGGLSNILLTAATDTATFAKQLDITEQEMKDLINTNPNEFLLRLANSLKGLPTDEVAKRLVDMGIKSQEATKVMSLLKDQTDQVAKYQKLAADEMRKGTSLTDEFNKKNTNAAAELDKMGKQVKSLSVEMGQALIPIVLKAGQGLLTFVNTIRAIPEFIDENRVSFAALAVALVTFNAQAIMTEANDLRIAASKKLQTIATTAATTAQGALNAVMALNPIALVVVAVASLVAGFTLLYNNSQTLRAGISGTWEAMKVGLNLITQFGTALKNLDFAGAAKIWSSGGTQIAQAFTKGYSDKIKSDQKTIEADHKTHTDRQVATSKTASDTMSKNAISANKTTIDTNTKATDGYLSDEQKKKAEHEKKVADDRKKANQDAIDATAKANIAAIASEKDRKLAQLKWETEQEKKRIADSLADQTLKLKQAKAADDSYIKQKEVIEKEYRDKTVKEETEKADKLKKLLIEQITDEHDRKVAELKFQAEQRTREIENTITDDKKKAEALDLINKKLSADIQKENDDQRQKETQKNQEKRDKELAGERQLFDSQFQAAVANADLNLTLAKNNANAIYQAKLERLTAEYNYNRQKLANEAAEEKQKNAELIADTDRRAQADKATDDRLKAQLKANDLDYETQKTRLAQEQTDQRKRNQEEFFSAIKKLMDGDMTDFMAILNKKLENEKAKNQEGLQHFVKTGQEVLTAAGQAIGVLQQLNQKYLDSQIVKINKERQAQLDSWEKQYKAGLISKEDYEKGVSKINAEFDEQIRQEKLKAWRRDQALKVAQAIINGASAALASLATMGWPLGLVGVAASGVITAAQIAIINKQQPPEFRKGGILRQGYVKNAGVLQGGDHGSRYGEGGISMVDRRTGQEVGEAEGGEPFMILSKKTRENNGPIIDMLLDSSLHKNGARIFRDGGTYGDYVPKVRRSYRDGGEMYYNVDDYYVSDGSDTSGSNSGSSGTSGDIYTGNGTEGAGAATIYSEEAQAQIEKSQQTMDDIAVNTESTVELLKELRDFLGLTFLDTIQDQNNALLKTMGSKMDELIKAEKDGNLSLGTTFALRTAVINSSIQESNGYLNRIAAKDLSVQTFVNVFNQISVVAGDSNLK